MVRGILTRHAQTAMVAMGAVSGVGLTSALSDTKKEYPSNTTKCQDGSAPQSVLQHLQYISKKVRFHVYTRLRHYTLLYTYHRRRYTVYTILIIRGDCHF